MPSQKASSRHSKKTGSTATRGQPNWMLNNHVLITSSAGTTTSVCTPQSATYHQPNTRQHYSRHKQKPCPSNGAHSRDPWWEYCCFHAKSNTATKSNKFNKKVTVHDTTGDLASKDMYYAYFHWSKVQFGKTPKANDNKHPGNYRAFWTTAGSSSTWYTRWTIDIPVVSP